MRVSLFKGTFDTTELKAVDVYSVLKDIEQEKIKHLIAKVRLITDATERSEVKKNILPLVTFAGTFTTRAKSALKKSSGLAILDFDHIQNLDKLKEDINNDKYTFSSFISPSGDGLKVLVKIPPVPNDEVYKEYYLELQKHYDKYEKTDDANKDISRACFLSIDKNIYINSDSETFTEKYNPPLRDIKPPTNVPLTDQNEIAERLEKWFKKNYSTSDNRNTNLHAFARQLNCFGVDQMIAENYLFRYEQSDFKQGEIKGLINSAYRYTSEH